MKATITLSIFGMILLAACKKSKEADKQDEEKIAIVTTIAGTGEVGFLDGPALSARFNHPNDVDVQADGTIYVTDQGNFRLRKISTAAQVTSVAGDGNPGVSNGNGTSARFKNILMLASDSSGNVYVTDSENPMVRKVSPNGDVSAYAGNGVAGFLDGIAATARFGPIYGICIDPQRNMILGDAYNYRVRKISSASYVTTIGGTGTRGYTDGNAPTSNFNIPAGVAIDKKGNVYVADRDNYVIRKITPAAIVSTFAGSGNPGTMDGKDSTAEFGSLTDMVIDSKGNLYASDGDRVRKIHPDGKVYTVVGGISAGFADGDATTAKFNGIKGLGIDSSGNLYVADWGNNRIRKISFQ